MAETHDIKKDIRIYMWVFAALIIGTVFTVWASYLDFGSPTMNVVVALVIASAKGFLVAGYFMHLLSERKLIYGILVATVFFFAGLMYLTVWSEEPQNKPHIRKNVP